MKEKEGDKEKEAPKKKSLGPLLPIIIVLVGMPVIAFAMTKFVIVPQLAASLSQNATAEHADASHEEDAHAADAGHGGEGGHGESAEEEEGGDHGGGGHGGGGATSNVFNMADLLVNVKNTNASRYLVASIAITTKKPEITEKLKTKEPMIRDAALNILMDFGLEDLTQSQIKNRAKARMIVAFNNTLGGEYVDNIFFTEWTVQ